MVNGRVAAYWLILALTTFAAYWNSLAAPFVLDDLVHVVNDPLIKSPLQLRAVAASPRPFVTFSLYLNHALGGLNVTGYHALNVVAHLLCGTLVFGFARFTLRRPALRGRYGRHADALATFIAAVFLLHPLQTESVTYISQRAEIFAAAAIVAGLWLSVLDVSGRWQASRLALLICIVLIGTLSKATFIVLPALVVLYDWCFASSDSFARVLRQRWRFYALLSGICSIGALRIAPQLISSETAGFGIETIDSWSYLQAQTSVVLYYLRLILVPDHLCFACGNGTTGPVATSWIGERPLLSALVLVTLCAAAVRVRRQHPVTTYGVLASLIALAPTSTVVPLIDLYFEHRLYLTIAFFYLAATPLIHDLVERASRFHVVTAQRIAAACAVLAVAFCAGLATLTVLRNEVYKDPIELWKQAAGVVPGDWRAQYQLARLHRRAGIYDRAVEHYENVIVLLRGSVPLPVYVGLADSHLSMGLLEDAAAAYERALLEHASSALLHRNLADTYIQLRRYEDAAQAGTRAVELEPQNLHGRKLLAWSHAKVGNLDDAIAHGKAAARLAPNDGDVRRWLEAWAKQNNGIPSGAARELAR